MIITDNLGSNPVVIITIFLEVKIVVLGTGLEPVEILRSLLLQSSAIATMRPQQETIYYSLSIQFL